MKGGRISIHHHHHHQFWPIVTGRSRRCRKWCVTTLHSQGETHGVVAYAANREYEILPSCVGSMISSDSFGQLFSASLLTGQPVFRIWFSIFPIPIYDINPIRRQATRIWLKGILYSFAVSFKRSITKLSHPLLDKQKRIFCVSPIQECCRAPFFSFHKKVTRGNSRGTPDPSIFVPPSGRFLKCSWCVFCLSLERVHSWVACRCILGQMAMGGA